MCTGVALVKSTNCTENKIFSTNSLGDGGKQRKVEDTLQPGTSVHATLKHCNTQEPLLRGLASIFILHTFFTGSAFQLCCLWSWMLVVCLCYTAKACNPDIIHGCKYTTEGHNASSMLISTWSNAVYANLHVITQVLVRSCDGQAVSECAGTTGDACLERLAAWISGWLSMRTASLVAQLREVQVE